MTQKELKIVRDAILDYLAKHPSADAVEITSSKEITAILPYHTWRQVWHVVNYQLTKIKTQAALKERAKRVSKAIGDAVLNQNLTITSNGYVKYTSSYSSPQTSIVGVIADTHEPYCHEDYLAFVIHTFKKYGVIRVVHIGDEVDNYALSYHEKDPNAPSAVSEAERAQAAMQRWYTTFPTVDVIVGNHSALPHRQATTAGIPKKFLKTYEEIWEAPQGWKWHVDLEIDGVLYSHGLGCTGPTGALDKAIRARQSVVIGHSHTYGGVQYHAGPKDMIFGMNVGCGVDQKAYAFDYSKNNKDRWTLGCGIVKDGKEAFFIPMNLNEQGRWLG